MSSRGRVSSASSREGGRAQHREAGGQTTRSELSLLRCKPVNQLSFLLHCAWFWMNLCSRVHAGGAWLWGLLRKQALLRVAPARCPPPAPSPAPQLPGSDAGRRVGHRLHVLPAAPLLPERELPCFVVLSGCIRPFSEFPPMRDRSLSCLFIFPGTWKSASFLGSVWRL